LKAAPFHELKISPRPAHPAIGCFCSPSLSRLEKQPLAERSQPFPARVHSAPHPEVRRDCLNGNEEERPCKSTDAKTTRDPERLRLKWIAGKN